MDRYFVWHDLHAAGPRLWNVVDRMDGCYDRNTGARYVAQCPDPEMAQRIADLLTKLTPSWSRSSRASDSIRR